MCSLNNAIKLYIDEVEKEDNKIYTIVKKINNVDIPLENKKGYIEYFNNIEEAEIERIYHQPDHTELLKIVQI